MKQIFWVVLGLLQLQTAVQAASIAPPTWPGDRVFVPNVKTNPASPLSMGKLAVVFEDTKLQSVRDAVGVGQQSSQGDASESLTWLCYTISSTKPAQRIWLTSSEMGGGIYIDGLVAISLTSTEQSTTTCPELPYEFLPVKLTNDIWLGAAGAKLRSIMGPPKENQEVWTYFYSGTEGKYDVTSSLVVKLIRGIASEIYVNHTSSD
jgi:hypothetical protein